MLSGSGHVGRYLTCPYHQWSYCRDGSLVRVPQQRGRVPEIDLSALGLFPADVGEWAGIVFARPTTDGPTLAESFAGLDDRLGAFARPSRSSRSRASRSKRRATGRCSWRITSTSTTSGISTRRASASTTTAGSAWESLEDNWWSLEPLRDLAGAPSTLRFLDDAERAGIGAHLLFPNIMIVTTGEYLATYEATPVAPDRTRLTLRVRSVTDGDGGALVECALLPRRRRRGVRAAAGRDRDLPAFGFGRLRSAHEEPVRRFHGVVRRLLRVLRETEISPVAGWK